jgi:hypothetical protein
MLPPDLAGEQVKGLAASAQMKMPAQPQAAKA